MAAAINPGCRGENGVCRSVPTARRVAGAAVGFEAGCKPDIGSIHIVRWSTSCFANRAGIVPVLGSVKVMVHVARVQRRYVPYTALDIHARHTTVTFPIRGH